METKVTAKNYTLRTDNGGWLGQVVLTSDGAFMSITDYGNFSFAWRSTGDEDFRKFILKLDKQYFAGKMANGASYITYGKSVNKAAELFTEKILPSLQEVLKAEIQSETVNN